MRKLARFILLLLTMFTALGSSGALAKPDDNQVKYWISTSKEKILVKHGFISFFDKKVNMDVSNIINLVIVHSEDNTGPIHTDTLIKTTFDYHYDDTDIPCEASISYSSVTLTGPFSDNTLKNVIVECRSE